MDYQNREGGRTGSGLLSQGETNAARRERMRRLAMETIDLDKDPYFMKNHLGSYECRLCLTLHVNEGSYLAHTQGKKHSANLARRAAREAKTRAATFGGALEQAAAGIALLKAESSVAAAKTKSAAVISATSRVLQPSHKIAPVVDPVTRFRGFSLQLHYPQLFSSPQHRFVSSWERRSFLSASSSIMSEEGEGNYVVVAAPAPYKTVGVLIPAMPMDIGNAAMQWGHWDPDNKLYTVQVLFKPPQQ